VGNEIVSTRGPMTLGVDPAFWRLEQSAPADWQRQLQQLH
jgi:hypothetical protein